jgi:hypothetical protein
MFTLIPQNTNTQYTPYDIRTSPNLYSRDKCELWAIVFIYEYLNGLSSQIFVSKYAIGGVESLGTETQQYLNPLNIGFNASEENEMLLLRHSVMVSTDPRFAHCAAMNHIYSYKDYIYRYWQAALKHFLKKSNSSFELVYCTSDEKLPYAKIPIMKPATENKPVREVFTKILMRDGIYIIYLHFRDNLDKSKGGHHTLSLVKNGRNIIFFCPLNGVVEFSGITAEDEFLAWIIAEAERGGMDYFSPTCTYYLEAAVIPLPVTETNILSMVPYQNYCHRLSCVKSGQFQKCSRCGITFYCSPECQKIDWPRHKAACAKKT